MKTITYLIPALLLLSACGTMRDTASYSDDVYDVPDRQALAAKAANERPAQDQDSPDDYYSPSQSQNANDSYRDYYDMTYNDPYYYNYGRFGFGTGIGNYGPGYGMGTGMSMSYGWPTSFGSMSVGYGTGYGAGYGYDPYWGNSWMSGYGSDPYGYYGYGNYGPGYGGYGSGYGPYQSPWGGCYGCYEPTGYNGVVYSPRPSMTSGSFSTTAPGAPRMMRNPAGLLDVNPSRSPAFNNDRSTPTRQGRTVAPRSNSRNMNREPDVRPSRSWEGGSSPSRSGGGSNNGGGTISSPRPR